MIIPSDQLGGNGFISTTYQRNFKGRFHLGESLYYYLAPALLSLLLCCLCYKLLNLKTNINYEKDFSCS